MTTQLIIPVIKQEHIEVPDYETYVLENYSLDSKLKAILEQGKEIIKFENVIFTFEGKKIDLRTDLNLKINGVNLNAIDFRGQTISNIFLYRCCVRMSRIGGTTLDRVDIKDCRYWQDLPDPDSKQFDAVRDRSLISEAALIEMFEYLDSDKLTIENHRDYLGNQVYYTCKAKIWAGGGYTLTLTEAIENMTIEGELTQTSRFAYMKSCIYNTRLQIVAQMGVILKAREIIELNRDTATVLTKTFEAAGLYHTE